MRTRSSILLLLIAVACFWQAGVRQEPLTQMRRDLHLTVGDPLENMPPLVAFTTVAMGGFRGVIADLLWLRASKMKDDGQYFELVQLADWITKLEPRMAQVWSFHSWNMAYNVSVLFNNPVDRWRWLRQGIVLLRDEGIRYNPGEPNLYWQLGQLYQHKMSGNTDQMNGYYKRWWADEMATIFDGPRPDYAAYIANTPAVADRVRRMKEVFKLDPSIMQQVDELYGPLDWRLPQAHAIYWAFRGRKYASGFSAVQADRMIIQSMSDAAQYGAIFDNPAENVRFMIGPNLPIFEKTRRVYEQFIAAHPEEETMKTGHRNFLGTALLILYTHHRMAEAYNVFEDLQKRYPSSEYAQGIDSVVFHRMTEFLSSIDQREATDIILGACSQSWFWLAMGDEDQAIGNQQLARTVWREYMKTRNTAELKERTGLEPFEVLNEQARKMIKERLKTKQSKDKLDQPIPEKK